MAHSPSPLTPEDLRHGYAGRTCLVTGADGFVGSHLVDALLALGARVHALVRASSGAGLRHLDETAPSLAVHRGDVRDPASMRCVVAALAGGDGPVVFHLAAQAHVGESWTRPYETVHANVLGTLNVLLALVESGTDLFKVSVAGSSEEHGDALSRLPAGTPGLSEDAPLDARSIYATTKVATDLLARNVHQATGLPAVTTRLFNNFGPRQGARYLTGSVITQALAGDTVRIGAPWPRRDFCHVSDGVRAHLHVALAGEPGTVYSAGCGRSVSVGDWAELALARGRALGLVGARCRVVEDETRRRPGHSEVADLRADSSRLRALTGWQPEVSWEDGLDDTLRWHAALRGTA